MIVSVQVLTILLLIQLAFGISPTLHNNCSTTSNFTADSPFSSNLDQLLSDLSQKTPPSGFRLHTVASTQTNQSVFGLAMCRGDTNSTQCASCVNDATANIVQLCPNNKEAFIWFDTCFLRYSDTKFFGKLDGSHDRFLPRVGNSTQQFVREVVILLNKLSPVASLAPKLFAFGEITLKNQEHVFGLVECTRDLSSVDCKKCIDATILTIPGVHLANVTTGGRIIGASCSVRYETFPFFF